MSRRIFTTLVIGVSAISQIQAFQWASFHRRGLSFASTRLTNSNPAFHDKDAHQTEPSPDSSTTEESEDILKATRFSKFAPDTNLPPEEFRAQLRENMKADLERRRREDPQRGNQPAKSYLDSL